MFEESSISYQTSTIFAGRVLAALFSFIVPVVLVRTLSVNDFGLFRQFVLLYEFFLRVLQVGLTHSLYYFLPKDPENKKRYLTNTIFFFSILGFLSLCFFTFLSEFIADLFNAKQFTDLMPLCGLYTMVMLIAAPFEPLLIIESKAKQAALLIVILSLLRSSLLIIFSISFNSVIWVTIALVIYGLLNLILFLSYYFISFGINFGKKNLFLLKQQALYSTPLALSILIGSTSKRIEKFILSMSFSSSLYAFYAIGNRQAPFISTLFSTVKNVILPKAVEMLNDGRVDQCLELIKKAHVRLFFVGIGSFFFCQTIAYDLITLIFTERYVPSVSVFRIISLLLLVQMVMYAVVLRSLGFTKDIFVSNAIMFLSSVPLSYFLIKYWALNGAALAAVLIFSINVVCQLLFSLKRIKKSITQFIDIRITFKLAVISCGLFVFLYYFQQIIPYKTMRVIISGSTFVILYSYLCYKASIINILREDFVRNIFVKMKLAKVW